MVAGGHIDSFITTLKGIHICLTKVLSADKSLITIKPIKTPVHSVKVLCIIYQRSSHNTVLSLWSADFDPLMNVRMLTIPNCGVQTSS